MSSTWHMLRELLRIVLVLFVMVLALVPLLALLCRWLVFWFRWAGLP